MRTGRAPHTILVGSMCGGLLLLAPSGNPANALGRVDAMAAPPQTSRVVDQVIHDACDKRVALLGESPTHGFGRTLNLKVEIVQRLVQECHYDAFFIESGAYDFLNIQSRLASGRPITGAMIAAAIGGIWATQEVEPLIPFLLARAQRGALVLGGLDDQLARGTWAQREMPADLVQDLHGPDKEECLAILRRHALWQYTNEAPYGPSDKARILRCIGLVSARLSESRQTPAGQYRADMLENLKRVLARDFADGATGPYDAARDFNARDRSMYANFRWLLSRLPRGSKVIVWTAVVHAAKDLSAVPGDENRVPLGSYVRRDFASDAFALGISALAGTYALGRQPVRTLPAAPPGSLEARAFAGNTFDVSYLSAAQLEAIGRAPARLAGPDFRTAQWSRVLDGLIVFREERPPRARQ